MCLWFCPQLVAAAETRTVGKRAVRILLECFLVLCSFLFTIKILTIAVTQWRTISIPQTPRKKKPGSSQSNLLEGQLLPKNHERGRKYLEYLSNRLKVNAGWNVMFAPEELPHFPYSVQMKLTFHNWIGSHVCFAFISLHFWPNLVIDNRYRY